MLKRYVLTVIGLLWGGQSAFAGDHAVINSQRSGMNTNVFVSQSVEGEYGELRKIAPGQTADDAAGRIWRGYGFRNAIGIELLKFTQFSISHTFLDLNSRADALEGLNGSRLQGEAKLAFDSPIGNLEAGGGMSVSKMDYRQRLEASEFYGSGYFYTLGVNYFLSQRVSFFSHGRINYENLVRNSGSEVVENIKSQTRGLGVGFSLWL